MSDAMSSVVAEDTVLLCDLCREPAVAVFPGMEPEMLMGFALEAGEPRRQWCASHWPNRPMETVT